jgi:hypothetical protein
MKEPRHVDTQKIDNQKQEYGESVEIAKDTEMSGDFPIPKSEFDKLKEQKDIIVASNDNASKRAIFESGAAWQREHHFVPHAMNAVEAAKEALARWPE